MNKIINPVVELTTDEDLSQFIALENEYVEKTDFLEKNPVALPPGLYQTRRVKTRVIAFIYDREDFNDELDTLYNAARMSAKREELRVGIVTDKKLIKKYKANHGTLWFPEGAYSSIVLKRYDGKVFYHDILQGNPPLGFHHWINRKSIRDVEEMTSEMFKLYEMCRMPIVIAFVDLQSTNKKVAQASS
jgi:hypothetical protein